jgi:hypothetical protein
VERYGGNQIKIIRAVFADEVGGKAGKAFPVVSFPVVLEIVYGVFDGALVFQDVQGFRAGRIFKQDNLRSARAAEPVPVKGCGSPASGALRFPEYVENFFNRHNLSDILQYYPWD